MILLNIPPLSGTWKARLEAIMATVSPNAPAPTPHYLSRQRSIIHIDMVTPVY